jgi:hypothetical protein
MKDLIEIKISKTKAGMITWERRKRKNISKKINNQFFNK